MTKCDRQTDVTSAWYINYYHSHHIWKDKDNYLELWRFYLAEHPLESTDALVLQFLLSIKLKDHNKATEKYHLCLWTMFTFFSLSNWKTIMEQLKDIIFAHNSIIFKLHLSFISPTFRLIFSYICIRFISNTFQLHFNHVLASRKLHLCKNHF